MIRSFFASTLSQILIIIAASSAITFVVFVIFFATVYVLPSVPPPPPWPWQNAYHIEGLIESVSAVAEDQRSAVISAERWPDMSVALTEMPKPCATQTRDTYDLEALLKSELKVPVRDLKVRWCAVDNSNSNIQILVGLGDKTLEIRTRKLGDDPYVKFLFPLIWALLFPAFSVALISFWAIVFILKPLQRLSAKADVFSQAIAIMPIEEEGPKELRRVARAFNLMQERVVSSMRDRTRALAAISHDLRTPLTRMRLQLETGDVATVRGKLLRDIILMQDMVASALAYLSAGFDREEKEWLDLSGLLLTLCDEFEEIGYVVSYEGPAQTQFFCKPNAMSRAITNLIDNATHFASKVHVTAAVDETRIIIDVADDGPGIPKDKLRDVVDPFIRLDASRATRPGSVGLGLAIVKEIVTDHDGMFELISRDPTGLIARLTFQRPLR